MPARGSKLCGGHPIHLRSPRFGEGKPWPGRAEPPPIGEEHPIDDEMRRMLIELVTSLTDELLDGSIEAGMKDLEQHPSDEAIRLTLEALEVLGAEKHRRLKQKLSTVGLARKRQLETATPATNTENPKERTRMAKTLSDLEKTRKAVLDQLSRLGKVQVGDDDLIFEGNRFVLPGNMAGDIDGAVRYLIDWKEQQEAEFNFTKVFDYRPWDGAAAFDRAMKLVFGTAGIGKITPGGFFEPDRKPELRSVQVGPSETIQVPWGRVAFSPLGATFELGMTRHRELGIVFALGVEAPRKFRAHIDAFMQVVEQEMRERSIYKGKAFTGGTEPSFLDTREVDPAKVIYSANVMTQLSTNLWSLLRHSDTMREQELSLKRAVLIEGPYGTGKTLAGRLTAREAVMNGWTFIICRPGRDNLDETLQTAQMYAPAVVWFEDIDVVAQGESDGQISKLLDTLDGITTKGTEVVAAFTTNHVSKIQKGVMRPGRLDAVIHIEELDDEGMEKLIKSVLPENLRGVINYPAVVQAFHGFLPAFAVEAASRALRYAIARGEGTPSPIVTQDLVDAANGLRPQLQLMKDAKEGVVRDPLSVAFQKAVQEGIAGVKVVDTDDDLMAVLAQPENV